MPSAAPPRAPCARSTRPWRARVGRAHPGAREANAELKRQIEERERVEEALRQAQRLEAVGQLTSGVAHDFNNLLTVIAGNIEFLERVVPDDRSRRRLDMMRGAAERGARLTAQSSPSRAASASNQARPAQPDRRVDARPAAELDRRRGPHRDDAPARPVVALVDATQIELIILNLAINARDAMAVGGCLTIETANVH